MIRPLRDQFYNEKEQEMPEAKAKAVQITVKVENHKHKGKPCRKGEKIKVDPEVAKMLEAAWGNE